LALSAKEMASARNGLLLRQLRGVLLHWLVVEAPSFSGGVLRRRLIVHCTRKRRHPWERLEVLGVRPWYWDQTAWPARNAGKVYPHGGSASSSSSSFTNGGCGGACLGGVGGAYRGSGGGRGA
jgi:hypothetical protein